MRGVAIGFHEWRGFARVEDLFQAGWCLGFVTVVTSHHAVPDLLGRYVKILKQMARHT